MTSLEPADGPVLHDPAARAGTFEACERQRPEPFGVVLAADRATDVVAAAIDALPKERDDLTRERNFAEADRIRRELTERGIVSEDAAGGARWRRSR